MMTLSDIQNCLNNNDKSSLEDLAQKSRDMTLQYFGRTISLYMPLYLSNYCSSHCTYCGFNSHNKIKRYKLTEAEMEHEMAAIAAKGIENILLLTGESYQATPPSYIESAVTIAKKYFPSISLEIHPLDESEYKDLFACGADGLTVYQETYDRVRYRELHLSGKKQDYDYRRGTAERAAKAGFRYISLGILLGLSDVSQDLFALYQHLRELERNYPGVEYSLSFPRLQPIKGEEFSDAYVNDITMIKIICMTRIFFPRVGINLSTRESGQLRNHAIELGVTRISAESSTVVGGYSDDTADNVNPQFDVKDSRSVKEIIRYLKDKNFDPILTDWRRIDNKARI